MRFHPLRPLPSISIDASKVQRAAPTCTVSLTSVSVTASMSGTSTSDASSSSSTTCTVTSMDIDPAFQATSERSASAFLAKAKSLVQFPTASSTTKTKRTHSLLRPSTLANSGFSSKAQEVADTEGHGTLAEEKEEEAEMERELPARKRTRTCAMVTPASPATRGRNIRRHSISASPRPSSAPASQDKYDSFDELLAEKDSTTPEVPPQATHPSPLAPEAIMLVLSPQEHLKMLQTQPNNLIYLVSLPPSLLYRKRRLNQVDSHILLYLYRTLVYGTQVRFNAWIQDSTSLDAQDAILALRLRTFLLSRRTPASQLIVDLESIASEGVPPKSADENNAGRSEWMQMVIASNAAKDFQHTYHLEPTTTHSVLSYQQLVATVYLRHFTDGSMSRYSWKRKRQTKHELAKGGQCLPSKLRESFSSRDIEAAE